MLRRAVNGECRTDQQVWTLNGLEPTFSAICDTMISKKMLARIRPAYGTCRTAAFPCEFL